MKKSFLFPLFGLLLILVGACSKEAPRIRPELRDITESVYASVTIQPDSMYQVHSAVTGLLARNLVEEGDSVSPGTILMEITNNAPRLNSENARLQMELAMANYQGTATPLNDLKARLRTAELTYRDDSVNLERQERLWSQNIGSQATYESRKLAFERSRNTLAQLRSEYRRLENELRTKMVQARNAYASSKADADEFTIESGINGKVYALYLEPGELVLPNQPMAMLGSPDTFVAEMLVDEMDIVKLQIGQGVLLSLDAYQERLFKATVSKIYPQKDSRNQTFKVEARFEDPPATLYPGLSGEANIIIDRREDVLTIPRNYLAAPDSVRTPDGLQKVVLGLQTLDMVEIRSGIDEKTELIKPEP
jgi:multidrug efflux pump subunit AcrA (membrane-fusion protein)